MEHQHAQAIRLGLLACVEHNEPHAKVFPVNRVVYVRAGVADYTGCLADARYLAVEAKSTKAARLMRSAVQPKQAQHLDAVSGVGGLAVLLVEFRHGSMPRRFACPWRHVPWAKVRSADSVGAVDLVEWEIQAGECYLAKVVK